MIEFSCFSKRQKIKENDEKKYLFVITPNDVEIDELDSWEGSIKQMSKLNQQYMDSKCDNIVKQISDLKDKVEIFSKRDEA